MRIRNDQLTLAPTDLSGYLNCRHLTSLDLRAAKGEFERPKVFSPVIQTLQQKGIEHEQGYLAHLKTQYARLSIELEERATLEQTRAAMASGADVIYQAKSVQCHVVRLRRFPHQEYPSQSGLGDWSYEAQDTKLARSTRAGTILQVVCLHAPTRGAARRSSPNSCTWWHPAETGNPSPIASLSTAPTFGCCSEVSVSSLRNSRGDLPPIS